MNKLDIAKKVVTLVVGAGTSKIVHSIIENNVNPETIVDKTMVKAASFVIGSMAADLTKEYTSTKIDEMAAAYTEARTRINEAKKTQETV